MSNNEYMRKYHKRQYRERMEEFRRQLGNVCAKCGAVENLEFDHIDSATKFKSIGAMWAYAEERIQEELAKCQLLCKSCHKIKSDTEQLRRYCKRGHERTPENVDKQRACRACRKRPYSSMEEQRTCNA